MAASIIVLAVGSQANAQRAQRAWPSRSGSTTLARPVVAMGAITALSATTGTLTLTSSGQGTSQAVNLTVTASTVIDVDGVTGQGLANLAVGMNATAVYQTAGGVNTALRIRASSKVQIAGTITAVSPDGSSLTIASSGSGNNGSSVTVAVSSATGVCLNGSKGKTTSSLIPGMRIQANCQVGSTGTTATQVQASDKLHVHGPITTVTLTAGSTTSGVVTITPADGTAVNLNVDLGSGTKAFLNGTAVTTLSGITAGMRAEARYQVTSGGNNASVLRVRSNNQGGS